MLKVHFRYENLLNTENKGAMVIVYESEPSPDGTHISASTVFRARIFDKAGQKLVNEFFDSLIPAIESCIENVMERKILENDNSTT